MHTCHIRRPWVNAVAGATQHAIAIVNLFADFFATIPFFGAGEINFLDQVLPAVDATAKRPDDPEYMTPMLHPPIDSRLHMSKHAI